MAWGELGKSWHDTTVDYCDVCGNLLIRRFWEFSGRDGAPIRACREDDERLYWRLLAWREQAAADPGSTVAGRTRQPAPDAH